MPTLTRADILLPEALDEARERSGRALRVFARLKPGVTLPQAQSALQPYFAPRARNWCRRDSARKSLSAYVPCAIARWATPAPPPSLSSAPSSPCS